MAMIFEVNETKHDCIAHYVEAALSHSRMIEHKLTEVLEKLEQEKEK